MSIDTAQFHQVFFEESLEGLDIMETGLLALDPGSADAEEINAVFRAAHSIKGGSGTFGFVSVADYTHAVETLLGDMRDGRRTVTVEAVDVLLRSVDVLRGMLIAARDRGRADDGRFEAQRAELQQVLAGRGNETGKAPTASTDRRPTAAAADAGPTDRDTAFRSDRRMMLTGDNPLDIVREPASLGSNSIRVDVEKIDGLIDKVGELAIIQAALSKLGGDFDIGQLEKLHEGLALLERHTRALQESVMQIRMVPIGYSFSRLPRLVHDLSGRLGKRIKLQMWGASTEVDKTVIERIGDPLVHLVRNSLDHGIETPEDRVAAGKPEIGTLCLSASRSGGNIVIEIRDDGRGLRRDTILDKAIECGMVRPGDELSDTDVFALIFRPGFTTAKQVNDISGRGVGLDIVRRNVNELGGVIEIDSTPGEGSAIIIHIPLTLARPNQ